MRKGESSSDRSHPGVGGGHWWCVGIWCTGIDVTIWAVHRPLARGQRQRRFRSRATCTQACILAFLVLGAGLQQAHQELLCKFLAEPQARPTNRGCGLSEDQGVCLPPSLSSRRNWNGVHDGPRNAMPALARPPYVGPRLCRFVMLSLPPTASRGPVFKPWPKSPDISAFVHSGVCFLPGALWLGEVLSPRSQRDPLPGDLPVDTKKPGRPANQRAHSSSAPGPRPLFLGCNIHNFEEFQTSLEVSKS